MFSKFKSILIVVFLFASFGSSAAPIDGSTSSSQIASDSDGGLIFTCTLGQVNVFQNGSRQVTSIGTMVINATQSYLDGLKYQDADHTVVPLTINGGSAMAGCNLITKVDVTNQPNWYGTTGVQCSFVDHKANDKTLGSAKVAPDTKYFLVNYIAYHGSEYQIECFGK